MRLHHLHLSHQTSSLVPPAIFQVQFPQLMKRCGHLCVCVRHTLTTHWGCWLNLFTSSKWTVHTSSNFVHLFVIMEKYEKYLKGISGVSSSGVVSRNCGIGWSEQKVSLCAHLILFSWRRRQHSMEGEVVFLFCIWFNNAHKWRICSILYHVYEKFWSSIRRVQGVQDIGLEIGAGFQE